VPLRRTLPGVIPSAGSYTHAQTCRQAHRRSPRCRHRQPRAGRSVDCLVHRTCQPTNQQRRRGDRGRWAGAISLSTCSAKTRTSGSYRRRREVITLVLRHVV